MTTSENGIRFIEQNEGFSGFLYTDNGKEAIGYGHDLLPGESFPNGISQADAAALLESDLSTRFEPALNALIPDGVTPTQNQYDALIDFCYNLGPADLATMMHHGWEQIPQQIPAWCYEHVNGVAVVNQDLKNRRAAEVALFLQA